MDLSNETQKRFGEALLFFCFRRKEEDEDLVQLI